MSLNSALPQPIYSNSANEEFEVETAYETVTNFVDSSSKPKPPSYGHRVGWVPRNDNDFNEGGAYPEVPCVQFPLGIGKVKKDAKSNAIPLYLGTDGKVRYDVLLRQDASTANKVIHAKYEDLIPAVLKEDESLAKPTAEELRQITEKTRNALEKQIACKIYAAIPAKAAPKREPDVYIRYTPSGQDDAHNSGAKQRVIRMVETARDPMEPSRFKINCKIPAAPPSPPAPVLHSPPRKVTVKEQLEWKIPPCISNWKNPKGYTIPLDKRLASDGRGLQDTLINDNFAKFAEALYIADRKAREAIEMRSQLENRLAQKEKEVKEENLVKLAQKAREERNALDKDYADVDECERDNLRHERHRDRERNRRIAKSGHEKRTENERKQDRDISEKIALGMPSVKPSDDALFDQRLFNQTRGLDTGYAGGEDEVYNIFDKPWNSRADLTSSVYRPSKNIDSEVYGEDIETLIKTSRFAPEKSFTGVDQNAPTQRQGPVQFEKKPTLAEDPLELDKFLSEAKKGKRSSDRRSPSPDKHKRSRR